MAILKYVHVGAGLISLLLALGLAGNSVAAATATAGAATANPWHEVVLKGDVSALRQLDVPGINDANAQGLTPLDCALALAQQRTDMGESAAEAVTFLREKNARCGDAVPTTPYSKALVLTRAALGYGQISLQDALAQYADAVNTPFPNGCTPIFWAAAFADANAIHALARAGADVRRPLPTGDPERTGPAPLHFAAAYNANPQVAQALVQLGAPINAVWDTRLSVTPLILAAQNSVSVTKALMDAGADLNACDGVSGSPFYYASGVPGMAGLLLEMVRKGVDPLAGVDGDGGSGGTAISHAAYINPDVQVMRTLLELGLPINEFAGYLLATPLMAAVRHNPSADVIRLLLESGAAVDLRDDEGKRADEGLSAERVAWLQAQGLTLPLVTPASAPALPTPLTPAELETLSGKSAVAAGGNYIVASARYEDITGKNIVVLTEPPATVNSADPSTASSASKVLYAQRLQDVDGQLTQLWRVTDYVRECVASLMLEFIPNSLHITDLDNNGVKEVWVAYKVDCRGDVSPRNMKIIMYEGTQKYAVRGRSKLTFPSGEVEGGEFTLDKPFAAGPAVFRTYAEKLWNDYVLLR